MTGTVATQDRDDFARLFERHQDELRLHCYRMLGSVADAEDLVQDTFLRAWRYRHTFSARSTFRAWLYRIATNACLDFLRERPRRVLPHDIAPPADSEGSMPAPVDRAWLEPCPDRWLEVAAPGEEGPEAMVVAKETIELAFLAAIQHLPPRQRAVLILRDVLGFPAAETAEWLDMSVASTKSALQRARATLRERLPAPASRPDPTEEEEAVLRRYMAAHERGDPRALAAVLSRDVRVSFPPLPLWAEGRDTFIAASRKHAAVGEYRFVPTRANGQPAVAIYLRPPGEPSFRPLTLEVLRVENGQVAEIIDFTFPRLFSVFALPPSL